MNQEEQAYRQVARNRLSRAYNTEKSRLTARIRAAGKSWEETEDLIHDVYAETWGLLILSSVLFKDMPSGGSDSCKGSDRRRRRELRKLIDEELIHPESPSESAELPESANSGEAPL